MNQVPGIQSLLQRIPDEFKPFAALGIGAVMLVCLVIFHGISLHKILVNFKQRELRLQAGRPHLWGAGFLFGWAIFMMLSLHIVEIIVWAMALVRLGLMPRPGDAIYFCANAYTTLGYGTVDLGPNWRNISPVIAISGLFTFAWTTSSLVNMVSNYMKIVEQLEVERMQELQLRSDARHTVWETIAKERQAEHALQAEAREQAKGTGFLERRKIWKEEKAKELALRKAQRQQAQEIRQPERDAENKLGESLKTDDSEVEK